MKNSTVIRKTVIIFLSLMMLLISSAAIPPNLTQTIYVDSFFGSDVYNGFTTATALKTIQRAVDIARPGSTIYVRSGTYNENIIIRQSGIEDARITLKSYSGESVVIDGGNRIALQTAGPVEYWILEGLTIRSTNRYTLRLGWWREANTSHWIVRNNDIYGANFLMGSFHLWENNNIDGTGYGGKLGDAGISDGGDSHHNIYRNNTIHDFTHHDARGIWSQGLTHDSIIENNTIFNIQASTGLGQGIDLDGAGNVEWRHIVRGNTVYNCSYVGIQLENTFDTVVENNLISQGQAGIIVINYDHTIGCGIGGENNQYGDSNGNKSCRGELTNIIIRNNIITTPGSWEPGYGGIIVWYAGDVKIWQNHISSSRGKANGAINFQGKPEEVRGGSILNNIITQGNGPAICASDLSAFTEDDHNLFYWVDTDKPYAAGNNCSPEYSLAEYQRWSGKAIDSQIIIPEFNSLQSWFFCAVLQTQTNLQNIYGGITGRYAFPKRGNHQMSTYENPGSNINE
ncbi:MAG: right-handed parallel beta-helix repeat-containing protein [Anaerolineaceae bacterium]|nr:right-handed parallel beta-helix repeat-containing protein [Anaerolineaceae bacterium]